jgi:hypothetical protein
MLQTKQKKKQKTKSMYVSYLRYLHMFEYNGVLYILCCVFVLFVFVLCTI